MSSYLHTLKHYATFRGKASRSEVWIFLIVNVIIKIILGIISVKMDLYTSETPGSMTLLDGGFSIAVLIPTIAVSVRRIHDIGLSGWWGWIFMPLALPMIIVALIPSKKENNTNIKSSNKTINNISLYIPIIMLILLLVLAGRTDSKDDNSKANTFLTTAFYKAACYLGSEKKCYELGLIYDNDEGIEEYDDKALNFYKKSCEFGNHAGCELHMLKARALALSYEIGHGEYEEDMQKAIKYQNIACAAGDAEACSNLGHNYFYENDDIVLDYTKARKLYKKGCSGGDAEGCRGLGLIYAEGKGIMQNYLKAANFYEKACAGDNTSSACSLLGELYEKGNGVIKDTSKAIDLYETSCNNKSSLGCMYTTFIYVDKNDIGSAIYYSKKACEYGDKNGCSYNEVLNNQY